MDMLLNFSPCPKGCGVDISKDIITEAFNYAEQNIRLKILIGYVFGNDGDGEGVAGCPPITFDS